MTTNPVLTFSPQAIRRRRLAQQMARARAKLLATHEALQRGFATADDVIAAVQAVYDLSVELDRCDSDELTVPRGA